MATATTMLPESAIHKHCPAGKVSLEEKQGSHQIIVNPLLESFTNAKVEDLLNLVVQHIETQLDSSEGVQSPTELPSGIQDPHSRQIEVCLTRFRALKVPTVSVRDYLFRLHLHCPFSTPKLLALVHYMATLDVLYLEISKVLRRNTAHRLILTAIVIASKILDDRLIPQVRWSVVGGINLHQLHGLELAFFFLMNGKCWITEESLINAGRLLHGQLESRTKIVDPLIRTKDEDIIWSSVGNRSVSSG